MDHPPPHFEAVYGEHEANVSIETGDVIDGRLPPTAARLVKQWTLAHQSEFYGSFDFSFLFTALFSLSPLDDEFLFCSNNDVMTGRRFPQAGTLGVGI